MYSSPYKPTTQSLLTTITDSSSMSHPPSQHPDADSSLSVSLSPTTITSFNCIGCYLVYLSPDEGPQYRHKPRHIIFLIVGKLGVRHVQAVLLSGALIVNHMQLGNLGIAVVVIAHNENKRRSAIITEDEDDPMAKTVSMVTGSFFYSQMVCSIIGGYLCTKVNNKILILSSSLTGVLVSYLTPTFVGVFSWRALFFVRLVQGAAQGLVKPVVYNMAARWLPSEEMLLLGPGILCGLFVGVCFMLMMGGYLGVGHGGWPSIFYFSGNIGLLWTIAFYGLGFASPEECFYISDLEKNYINDNIPSSLQKPYRHNIPWKKIFTNIPLWTLLICLFANNWALHVFVKLFPVYLQTRLHYTIHKTGIVCGLPFLFMCITTYSVTILFHYLRNMGKLNHVVVRHACNAIAQFGAAYCFMISSSSEKLMVTLVFHHLGMVLCSLQLFGFYMSFYDLSPTYIGLTSGIFTGLANVGSILGPHLTLNMYNQYQGQDHKTWAEDVEFIGWRRAYDIMSLNYFIAGSVFMFFGQTKLQDFDRNEERKPTRHH